MEAVRIEGGFAEVGAGAWLMGHGQPAAFFGAAARRRRTGWFLRDRAALDLVETTGATWCADAARPFLTHIPCAAPITAVSAKVLVAPAAAHSGAELVKVIPMSRKGSFEVSKFGSLEVSKSDETSKPQNFKTSNPQNLKTSNFVVMATASRTARVSVEDGETLAVRPAAVVAWTGNHPTGFVRRLGLWDVLLPRTPRDLLLHFHGPCIVWIEGFQNYQTFKLSNFQTSRRAYGI